MSQPTGGPPCCGPASPTPSAPSPVAPGHTGGQRIVTPTPTPTADERIDYVFARSACGVGVHDSHVFADQPASLPDGRWLWPSDHLAVVSEVGCAS